MRGHSVQAAGQLRPVAIHDPGPGGAIGPTSGEARGPMIAKNFAVERDAAGQVEGDLRGGHGRSSSPAAGAASSSVRPYSPHSVSPSTSASASISFSSDNWIIP